MADVLRPDPNAGAARAASSARTGGDMPMQRPCKRASGADDAVQT